MGGLTSERQHGMLEPLAKNSRRDPGTPCEPRDWRRKVSTHFAHTGRRTTLNDLIAMSERGQRWSMITAYDYLSAGIFEEAGAHALLVGDSAAMVVYGYDSTLPVTVEELMPLVRAVVRGSRTPLVIADLPFGS